MTVGEAAEAHLGLKHSEPALSAVSCFLSGRLPRPIWD